MQSKLAMSLFGFGMIFVSFGTAILVIGIFAARHGTPHAMSGILAVVFLVGGAILCGGGVVLERSGRGSPGRVE
jgi:hypothetical protein